MKPKINQRTAATDITVSRRERPLWLTGLQEDYEKVFVHGWTPFFGALLMVIMTMVLMAGGLFWGVFGGLKLWGDHFNNFIGLGQILGIDQNLKNLLMHRISLLDITLVLGAFFAALMSGQFSFRRSPKLEYIWGALGGVFMGLGATLAGGCTIGGFFTPLMFASPAGWAMWGGLSAGAFLGLKLLVWSMENITWGSAAPKGSAKPFLKSTHPFIGIAVLGIVLFWAASWYQAENSHLVSHAIIILVGFGFGFILHRSRFCVSRVFREPFMTGDGTMTKAMILALALGIPISSQLLQHNTVDPYVAIPATFWLGSSLGGFIFGLGMIFAGGCASGALWRMGEGQLKLVVTVFFFGWSGSVFSSILKRWDVLTPEIDLDVFDGMVEVTKVGYQAYLPDLSGGWTMTYVICFGVLAVWYLLVRYNESTGRFTVI